SRRDEWVLLSAFINYRLDDGTKLDILQQPAWCPACARFVIAELIPSAEEFEAEISKYRSADGDTLQMWAFVSNGASVGERIAELTRRIEWGRERRSPPRCLECGGLGSVPIPATGGFFHPQTGERVVVGDSGWADTAPWFAEFSPEGEQL